MSGSAATGAAGAPQPEDPPLTPEELEEKARLELRKLRREVRGFRVPTWWEVVKTLLTVSAIALPLLLGVIQFRESRFDRAVDLLYDKPLQGAALLRSHGDRGLEAMVRAIADEAEQAANGERKLGMSLLRHLGRLESAELEPVLPILRERFSKVELDRSAEILGRYQVAESNKKLTEDLSEGLCAQGRVNDLFERLLGEDELSAGALVRWSDVRSKNSDFEKACERGSEP